MTLRLTVPVLLMAGLLHASPAFASLFVYQTFVGNVGVSTDGFGSLSQAGTISAEVPAGATVLGAWLYSSNFGGAIIPGGTLNGGGLVYGPAVPNHHVCCGLSSNRANVTHIVKPVVDLGPGGVYDFNVTETDGLQDGTALVVVYELTGLPVSTVGILDGFSAAGGDSFSLSFADPLNPLAPGFGAEMRLGIGFGCCGETSTVRVNGTDITTSAGNKDDGEVLANGSLFTMGGFNDPFSPFLPTYDEDHERYNLVPQISLGDTSILVETHNPSNNDNLFLAVIQVTHGATVDPVPVPEPVTLSMIGLAGGAFALRRRAQQRKGAKANL